MASLSTTGVLWSPPSSSSSLLRTCRWNKRLAESNPSACSSGFFRRWRFRPAVIAAQVVPFKARRQVDVLFEPGPRPPEDYVREVERVVNITFPDSARIRYVGNSVWRARLKPISFFHLSATPVCDIRVFHENQALQLSSNKLALDFTGLPDEFKQLDFNFSLLGQLTVAESNTAPSWKRFKGWVNLGLRVHMPLPFSMMPESILTPVGDNILDRILGAMESALLAGIIRDYRQWCKKQSNESSPVASTEVCIRG